jgi:glycerophosphoryl diester phosphodiesterase
VRKYGDQEGDFGMARGQHRRPHRARNSTVGVLGMALALFAAAGCVESAHAAIVPARPFVGFDDGGVTPLVHGHAHNDYEHRHALSDALSRGYTSIEADVVLVRGKLLVGHDLLQATSHGGTLRALYLDPLADWVARNGGTVFGPGGPPLTLLIDVKSEAKSTWRALENLLGDYADMMTRYTADGVEPGAVRVVVSGNRATDLVVADEDRYTALDGRVEDLDGAAPADLMPLISERWRDVFRWSGRGEIPGADQARMRALVQAAHEQGRQIRFYDSPDSTAAIRENVWRAELAAGVDLINVDHLDAGRRFLLANDDGRPSWAIPSGAGHRLAAGGVRRTP